MKKKTREYMLMATATAAEMIRSQIGGGGSPEEYLGKGATENDLREYAKCCDRVAKHLESYSKKYL